MQHGSSRTSSQGSSTAPDPPASVSVCIGVRYGGQVWRLRPSRLAAGRTHLFLFFGQLAAREAEAANGRVVDAREHRREGSEVVLWRLPQVLHASVSGESEGVRQRVRHGWVRAEFHLRLRCG